ncbi:protein AF1q-like [Carassius carassius]|uniref:protein AF1q-like n=1 Tax=Carassius carassius TaxID=217509 RepID=UPI00286935CF|nr:protein AF1q-like [Carassius carassius]
MLDTTSSQFDSFMFWRQPIPSLDLSELEDLGISIPKSKGAKLTKSSQKPLGPEEQEDLELLNYSTFNYWKEPIASVDTLDFSLLL